MSDGRVSFPILLSRYLELEKLGWEVETITIQRNKFPIVAFKTPLKTKHPIKSLWILGGVHGEEPAGPNAFYQEIKTLDHLAKKGIPVVFIPLLNPLGYVRNWRYENEKRNFRLGHSVVDAEPLLLSKDGQYPRTKDFPSKTAKCVFDWITQKINLYLPELVIDHHEDKVAEKFPANDPRNLTSCYVYAYGKKKNTTNIAQKINEIFVTSDMPVVKNGTTRFGEKIINGLISNSSDGSIDEFLSSSKFFDRKTQKPTTKYPAKVVIVVETTIPFDGSIPLSKRQNAHANIIKSYSSFWNMIK